MIRNHRSALERKIRARDSSGHCSGFQKPLSPVWVKGSDNLIMPNYFNHKTYRKIRIFSLLFAEFCLDFEILKL